MAVDVASSNAPALSRVAAFPARWALAGIVGVSFVLRSVLALGHVTAYYLPDEYVYSALARGIATSGRPLIRNAPAHFPALLEPLLAAPFALASDPLMTYRLTQGMHALAMSLAAVPAYLLARRLGLGNGLALGAAALAVAGPNMVYASFILAEPVAYPLVLTAVYAGVCALANPTRRAQVFFAAASGLATFARVQYVVLPLVFLGAALVVERGSVREVVRRLRLSLAIFGAPILLLAAVSPHTLLGPYASGLSQAHIRPLALLHWMATDSMLLAYAAGWILVPGALVGLTCALVRPGSRAERAFAAFTVLFAGCLFGEAALIAGIDSKRFQERYLFALLPLVAPAFGLYVKRGGSRRRVIAGIALALLVLSVRVPLSGYTVAHGHDDSPTLLGVLRLEQLFGTANGSLAVAVLAAVLSLLAIALTLRARRTFPLALGLTVVLMGALSAGAFSYDVRNSRTVRATDLRPDARWVDHAALGSIALLQTTSTAPPGASLEQLFWNRSIGRVLLLGGTPKIDAFATSRLHIANDGRLLVDARTFDRPLLIQAYGATFQLTNATRVARSSTFELWRPDGTPRVSLLALGRYYDSWLARTSTITIWPGADGRVEGTLRLPLSLPKGTQRTPLLLTAPGIRSAIVVAPGERRTVSLRVSTAGPWTLQIRTSRPGYLYDERAVSVQSANPTFRRSLSGPEPPGAIRASSACCSRSAGSAPA